MTTGAPVGRDEVVAAILEAAAELFAARGPAATSIRDIAAKSNVNHGLVFRHIGSKEKLVGAVLDHLGQRLKELIEAGAPADVVDAALDQQLRVIARAALDGYPVGELQTTFPNMTRLLDEFMPRYADENQARLAVANIIALQLGWRLLGPFLRSALGLGEMTDDEVRTAVGVAVERLAEPPAAHH
ncbi:TetR/AcrR family transcriptional regulator [Mycobacterium sp. PDNC021]|uniref:TetR/AcrR family transcriptional regulator n=1 Tax=Mycobacterium sp. PDNC021 TaxID=3391399 RepID=UPI003AABECA6